MNEKILNTITEYEKIKQLLENERNKMTKQIKKIEKAQRTVNKLDIEGLEVTLPSCESDIENYNILTRDIKVCTSVLRRLETVYKVCELNNEENLIID